MSNHQNEIVSESEKEAIEELGKKPDLVKILKYAVEDSCRQTAVEIIDEKYGDTLSELDYENCVDSEFNALIEYIKKEL